MPERCTENVITHISPCPRPGPGWLTLSVCFCDTLEKTQRNTRREHINSRQMLPPRLDLNPGPLSCWSTAEPPRNRSFPGINPLLSRYVSSAKGEDVYISLCTVIYSPGSTGWRSVNHFSTEAPSRWGGGGHIISEADKRLCWRCYMKQIRNPPENSH